MWVLKKLNIWNYPTEPGPGVPTDVTEVIEVETPAPAAAPKLEKESQRKLNLEGEITILDKSLSMGVLSNFYRFKVEDVHPDLKRGAKVIFNAVYDSDSTFWMATDILPKPSQLELEIKERSMYKSVDYKVEQILPDRVIVGPGSGNQAQSVDMKLELTKSDLPQVVVGDWLRLSLVAVDSENGGDVSTAKVVKVEFTEKTTRVGTITKYQGRYCVDNTIFFTNEVIECGRTPQLDDRVRVIAIASDQEVSRFPHHGVAGGQYLFRKRALCITYDNVISRQTKSNITNGSDDWIDEEPVINSRDEYFNELIADKNKVRIRPNRTISFQSKKLKSTSSKVVTVENLSEKTIFLNRILNNGVQDVAKFELIFEEGSLNTNEMLISLQPHCPWNFEVKCTPYQFGRTKELLTFDFGTFQIGRWLFVHSLAHGQNDMSLYTPEIVGLEWQKRKLGHNPENLMVERNMKVISAPQLVRTPFFIPNKIKSYGVPRDLLRCFKEEDEETLLKLYPTTKDELSYKNYMQRFQVSLWFEEIENLLARREYDMHDVVLQPDKDGHTITVPRFREFYPPVLMGDPVLVYESLKSTEMYRGTIMKIFFPDEEPPKILIRFHEKFNRTYDGGPRTIQFGLGRTSFKRMHFAIEHAIDYLGPQWLFPFELTLKESRICFIEDAEDNYHPAIKACDPQSGQRKQENSQVVHVVKEKQDKRSRSLWSFQGNVTVPFSLDAVKLKWYNHQLNDEQKDAVRRILKGQGRPLPYIIFGPPGTGKTVTVVEAIMQVYFLEGTSRILVTVPSNAAADLIAEKLVATNRFKPGDFVRLNGFIRSGMSMTNTIADFCEDGEYLDSIAKNRLIICTVTTAGQFFQLNLNTGHFSHVFVDEAGYCTEPETMIPCVLAAIDKQSQVILAGDPEQLGPVLMCDIAFNQILECSFLERLMSTKVYNRDETTFPDTKYNPVVLTKLVRSYRAHPILLKLPSKMFYADELVSHAKREDAYDLCEQLKFLPKQGIPLVFHGVDGNCRQDIDSPSWYNLGEVHQVIYYVKKLRECGLSCDDIGIITPYRKQVEKIRIALNLYLLEDDLPKIASVQEFQGGERKVMIISTVRSISEDIIERKVPRLDFLYSKKRFNVAITRAKGLMIIVGNPEVLSRNTYWRQLLEYSVHLGVYTGCHLPKSVDPRWDSIMDNLKKNTIPELVNVSEGSKDSDDEEYHCSGLDSVTRFN